MQELKHNQINFTAGRWPLDKALPTVIFIHGSGGSHILWDQQVSGLCDTVNTIALDLPGHGKSDGDGLNQVADYAEVVYSFIESIEAPHPIPCGLSIGGAIVLQLLIEKKGKYTAGILVNTGAKLRVLPLIFESIEKDYPGFVNSMYTFGISPKTDPAKIKPLTDSMANCPPLIATGDFEACNDFDVIKELDQIDLPVLVLTASDDQLTPVKYGAFLADRIKQSTLLQIEDAGHLSPMEKPQEVCQAIEYFVKTLGH